MASVLNQPAAGLITFHQRNAEATIWVGNLDQQVSEELVTELMTQVGPIVSVGMPRDKVTNTHSGYVFVEFETVDDADYAIRIMNGVQMFGKPIKVNKAYKEDKKAQEKQMWQALIFIGNLAPSVDEGALSRIFSAFGAVLTVNIDRTEEGTSKGYGFIQFDSFESADLAIESMNRQYVHNQQINVQYARRKDSDTGERHGSEAERRMARLAMANQQNLSKSGQTNASTFAARRAAAAPVSVTDLPGVGTNLPTSASGLLPTFMTGGGYQNMMGANASSTAFSGYPALPPAFPNVYNSSSGVGYSQASSTYMHQGSMPPMPPMAGVPYPGGGVASLPHAPMPMSYGGSDPSTSSFRPPMHPPLPPPMPPMSHMQMPMMHNPYPQHPYGSPGSNTGAGGMPTPGNMMPPPFIPPHVNSQHMLSPPPFRPPPAPSAGFSGSR